MTFLAKEQIHEIEQYHLDHKLNIRDTLKQLGYSEWKYYKTKRLTSTGTANPKGFIPLRTTSKNHSTIQSEAQIESSSLTMEIRTVKGTEIRLIGKLNTAFIKDLIAYV